MTFFDVRIPELKMTVVASGWPVHRKPVTVDEFRMGVAETYDVLVEPKRRPCVHSLCPGDRSPGYARARWHPTPHWSPRSQRWTLRRFWTHGEVGMWCHGSQHAR